MELSFAGFMIRAGELHYAREPYMVWDMTGVDASPVFMLSANDPCFVVETNGLQGSEGAVCVITPKGVGWVYAGALRSWYITR